MRGILISPYYNRVIEVYVGDDIVEIYKALSHGRHKVTCFSCPPVIEEPNAMFLDEEALFKKGVKSFIWEGWPDPLFGNALILGVDEQGGSCDAKISLEFVHDKVSMSNYVTTGSM